MGFAPRIHITIFDHDPIGKDEVIGKCMVPLDDLTCQMPAEPTWFPLYDSNTKITEGSLLASFQLIPYEQAKMTPASNITPKYRKCNVEVTVISARDLHPTFSLFKVSKPLVEVDAGEKEKHMVKTLPKQGERPVYLETLRLPVEIAEDPVFAPFLHLKVVDRFALGLGALPLGPLLPWKLDEKVAIKVLTEISPYIQPPVTEIPGAKLSAEEAKEEKAKEEKGDKGKEESDKGGPVMEDVKDSETVIEIPQGLVAKAKFEKEQKQAEEKTPLLGGIVQNEEVKTHVTIKVPDVEKRTIPDVQETVVVEEVKEPQKPERLTFDYELERELDLVPCVDVPIYRGKKKVRKFVRRKEVRNLFSKFSNFP